MLAPPPTHSPGASPGPRSVRVRCSVRWPPGSCAVGSARAKPFSEASERNREPILAVLKRVFASSRKVLEIGSGTGQHAAYFSAALPHLAWQASDVAEHLAGIRMWGVEPIELDVDQPWPKVD